MLLKNIFVLTIFTLACLVWPAWCRAMPAGAILYRTSSDGQMYGYSSDSLIQAEQGIIKNIYSGHVGIYIGQENGEDYVVEALADGIVKTPLRYFVNLAEGEKFLGAKVPRSATPLQRAKAVAIAKGLVGRKLAYDLGLKTQKGPDSGEWTCVGLVEKLYESADISNPYNLQALEYDPAYYAVDITPDGFDNYSLYNSAGDCFSEDYEFSKIARRRDLLIPAPELIGFDAGLEQAGERYIFLPYTQFLQSTLAGIAVDKTISSDFSSELIRGKTPGVALALRWSLLNNPWSSLKKIVSVAKQAASNLTAKFFSQDDTQVILTEESGEKRDKTTDQVANVDKAAVKVSKNNNKDKTAEPAEGLAPVDQAPGVKVSKHSAGASGTWGTSTANQTVSPEKTSPTPPAVKKTSSPAPVIKVPAATSQLKSAAAKKNASSSPPVTAVLNTNPAVVVNQSANQGNPDSISEPVNEIIPVTPPPPSNIPKIALINKVYSTDNKDWIELFNPTDADFDLAEASYRLEKAKTAEDPSLMMRLGNAADGYYPGGTVIKAHDSYLIVRDDANDYYLDRADAIATRDEFSWSGSGYTIYLGTGAISSSADPDITAALGFGPDATYFQGSGPAPEILENYILNRIADNSDNATDFNLILADDPDIILEPPDDPPPVSNTSTPATTTEAVASSSLAYLFIPPEPLDSPGINNLWHFDECYGEAPFAVGYWGCAREIGYTVNTITATLTPTVNLGSFSIGFYFRNNNSQFPKIDFRLSNSSSGQSLDILFLVGLIKIYNGLPNAVLRNYTELFADNLWHQLVLVVNQSAGYWAIYIDGEERFSKTFIQTMPGGFDRLFMGGDTGLVLIDDLAIWQRPLSPEEILDNYELDRPLAPMTPRSSQLLPELIHFWDFNEGHYLINEPHNLQAFDSLSSSTLDLWDNPWGWRAASNSSLAVNWPASLQLSLPEAIDSKDLSLSFWWRNSYHPEGGRIKVGLKHGGAASLALVPNYYEPGFWFNGNTGKFSIGVDQTIPHDNLWHHLALVYDSYRYALTFYVDGLAKASTSFIWIQDGLEPDSLEIAAENYGSEIDDLAIWRGALNPEVIQEIFANN